MGVPRRLAVRALVVGLACVGAFVVASPVRAADAGDRPLKAYVSQADSSYRWVKRQEKKTEDWQLVELTLTSQTWHDIVWKHQLFVIRPAVVRDPKRAVLLISGGGWSPELEQPALADAKLPDEVLRLASFAEQIQAPVAVLRQVPQQPIFDGMVEDEIISYTFEQFIKTRDHTWPLLLPMVKSAVRAMDAVQEFASREWSLSIEHFTLTGASKRGWTTWLTSAMDDRVDALAPMVIDVLNMGPQMKHQVATWGKFSDEIEDYTRRDLQSKNETEAGKLLNEIVDPYSYRALLVQPKMIILGTNDRYWPLDALSLYWDGLEGEKHVCYVPNNGHGLKDLERVFGAIGAIHRQASGELKLPNLEWELSLASRGPELSLRCDATPAQVLVWTATAPTRDFRDAAWTSQSIELVDGAGMYQLEQPARGYCALFGEVRFETDGLPYFLSTNVQISPALKPTREPKD